jgi:membrane fusion protein, multidrug efflux system
MRMRVLPIVALALGTLSGCGGEAADTPAERVDRPVAVAAVELAAQDLSLVLRVAGNVEPLREFRVAARMAGILRDVRFEEGRRVSAGGVLARFDLAEQQAQLSRARTVLQHAEAQYQRAKTMRDRQLLSEMDYENARAERGLAQSEVELWRARMALGTVTAPATGVITEKFVESGTAVSAGDPLFVVADVSTLVVRVGLSNVHAARLQTGQSARIVLDALPGQDPMGTIRRIFPAADPDSRLRTVEIELRPAPGGGRPAPGSLARVEIDVDRRPAVLAVPNEALLGSADETSFVFVIDGDRLVRRAVIPGVSRRDWTEMREGVTAGELVVASNPAQLREGMRVRVVERIAPPGDDS